MDLFDDPDEQQRLVGRLVALYEKTGNLRGLVDWTAKQAEAQAPQQPRRAAELHFRNARLLLERDNSPDAALLSARRALELAPDVVELRGFVADLLARTPNQALLAIEEHRKILRARNVRPASLRALHKLWYAQRAHDRAFCAAEVLSFLGAADEGEELYYSDSKKRMKKEATTEGLDATQLTSLVAHPQQRNAVREIVALCGQELAKLFADDHLEPVEKRFIFRAKADDSLRAIADKLAHNLDLPPSSFELWQSQTKKSGVEACAGSPLVLFVGADVRRVHSTREQCFLLGRKLMAFQSGHHLLRGMDAHRLSMLLTAIGRAVDRAFPTLADGAELEVWTKKGASALSRRTRAALAEPVDQVATHPRAIDLVAFLDAAPLTENHAGLLLAGAFDAAVRIIARDTGVVLAGDQAAMTQSFASQPQLADLVSYSVSDEYFQARQALHLAIDT